MLSQLILLRYYGKIIEACLWLLPIVNFFLFGAVSKYEFNPVSGTFGLILTFIACAIVFGGLRLLIDIHQLLMDIRQSVKND